MSLNRDKPEKRLRIFLAYQLVGFLKHNERALGNRWDAGIELSDPNNRERLTKKAIKLGATAEDLALALNITTDEAVEQYNVLRADELQEIPRNNRQLNEALEEVRVTATKLNRGEILEEVDVDSQPTKQALANVAPPAPDAETQLREMAGDRPLPPVGQRRDDPVVFSPPPPDAETQLRDMAGDRPLIAATQKQDLPEPDTSNVVALSVPQQQMPDNTFTPEPPEISPTQLAEVREYLRTSNITESKFDLNDPMQMELINVARSSALLRLAKNEPLFLPRKNVSEEQRLFICLMLCNLRLRQRSLG